ncbi:1-deoxy-D-xylulose 5-phosphate reductoisomerase [Alkalihalophilus pseudofirmus OF4]|uniref:1-deoxy-D-xylulose 5-phosphate reductoisomerase n=2 Tax=Alkalihalophilus pseudofirmus TaxID=79885 RepID=D3FSD1_ALKPO|nr:MULTISPECIES: 1-deoxy-D-xylulose-5-phosphate reductoisomerase [Alkalihalophilus]ADC48072.1 1-deoxy-D-xylulose 5-phosphate reductoisomerase [Alkalihalophilus pseudofirmus OF4]MDV2885241.1 1-deoxy-D-xylulose-5-phosphate reductoisomerase [Alkalihalophilus pseudofirmus]MED1602321.1 1-deoxy-D-xylulose-5-phosphate reductoisomerase [Alkalihalophilus marmarensis]WEG19088.1 1-deoxy-D-xylulose-5-phosphate reductoisomerase [Alkalihalophilus pseudofirmus]
MKKISLLGATGSIGTQTLDVIKHHSDQFSLIAMSVGRNINLALDQINMFKPSIVSVMTQEDAQKLQLQISDEIKVVYGEEGLIEVAANNEADILVNAVIGSVGLAPTLKAIEAGKTIAIANKETLVTAGHIVTDAAKKHQVPLLPVDSEHSAIFQALNGESSSEVDRLILTASGGSFRDKTRDELNGVTVEEALNHPNWSMGAKITIDSATMMNKGLEVIEAHWLFDIPYDNIDVVLHKESIIHSMVEFVDRSVIAQLGTPDMKVPIQYALTYPNRLEASNSERLNLWEIGTLNFSKLDTERYRCMKFAYEAGRIGGTMPTVLNAANEEAVAAFLDGKITFLDIEDQIEQALERHEKINHPTLDVIKEVDRETRKFIHSLRN